VPGALFRGTLTYQVPVTAGQYAPDFFGMCGPSTTGQGSQGVAIETLTVLVQTLTTGAQVEWWFLDPTPGVDPTNIGNYVRSSNVWSVTGFSATVPLTSWPGGLLRVKSGGTLGASVVSYSAA